jgi:hypothetical protein
MTGTARKEWQDAACFTRPIVFDPSGNIFLDIGSIFREKERMDRGSYKNLR